VLKESKNKKGQTNKMQVIIDQINLEISQSKEATTIFLEAKSLI
jgi:hypothetical protein